MCNIEYQYLRPKKAAALKRWHEEPFEHRDTLQVWQGKNATLLPVRKNDAFNWTGLGGVIDQEGNYVDLSATLPFVKIGYPFEHPQYKDEKVVYCGYLIHHWGHFLVDAVTRLWYYLENDPTIDKYVFLLDEGEQREIRGNYRIFLELLGIWDRLEFINQPTTYREVVVPELAFRCRKYYSEKYLSVFDAVAESVAADPSWETPAKIYLSRSQLKKDGEYEFGFEALDSFYSRNGYAVLFPEKIPLDQMIHYIRNAQVVASASGSAPHNMLFGKPGQTLEILERCVVNNDWQSSVNRMRQLHTIYIDANISIYTVSMCGPFIVGYNAIMERYASDHGFVAPEARFTSEKFFRSCFINYMKAYKDLYQYRWFIEDYLIPEMDYHLEAYEEGYAFYREYLDGSRPFLWHHYFSFHYWKQFIKRLIRK